MDNTARRQYILQMLRGKNDETALEVKDILIRIQNDGHHVHMRTIRRDIEFLSRDYGVAETKSYPKRYYVSNDFQFHHQLQFNEKQLNILLIALNNLRHTSHHYFENYLCEVEALILGSLPNVTVDCLTEVKKRYHFDYSIMGKPSDSNLQDFEAIVDAINKRKVIECKNNSPYKDQTYNDQVRKLAPLAFVLSANIPYVLCFDLVAKKIKRFRVNRLSEITLSKDELPAMGDIDFSHYASSIGGWGNEREEGVAIRVECDSVMAHHFLEKKIHHSQSLTKIDDESYGLSFHCALSNELVRIIASFGAHINSIEPAELEEKVRNIWESGIRKIA